MSKEQDAKGLVTFEKDVDILVKDAVLKEHEFSISIVAHYAVDFAKRANEAEYQEKLK